jgi:hypothetical protein
VPTLIREAGFEVRIYTLDHPPPHVHVAKAGAIVKIELSTHHAIEIVGRSPFATCSARNDWSREMQSS